MENVSGIHIRIHLLLNREHFYRTEKSLVLLATNVLNRHFENSHVHAVQVAHPTFEYEFNHEIGRLSKIVFCN